MLTVVYSSAIPLLNKVYSKCIFFRNQLKKMEERENLVTGSAVLALAGRECVVVASDSQFSNERILIASNVKKVFQLKPHILLAIAGLYSDSLTLFENLRMKVNLYEVSVHKEVTCDVIVAMTSTLLYEKRFGNYLVETVVCSLVEGKAVMWSLDCLGFPSHHSDFVAAGSCKQSLLGLCEVFWKPDMSDDEAMDVACHALTNATQRDVHSGCAVVLHMLTKEHTIVRTLKARSD